MPEPIGEVLPKTISNVSTVPAPICIVATLEPCCAVIVEFTFTLNGTCAVPCPHALAQNAKRATKTKNEEWARVAILGINIEIK
jgi:hypothetical protein